MADWADRHLAKQRKALRADKKLLQLGIKARQSQIKKIDRALKPKKSKEA